MSLLGIYARIFLCDLEVDKESEQFYVNGKKVDKVDLVGFVVSIKEKFNLTEFESECGS